MAPPDKNDGSMEEKHDHDEGTVHPCEKGPLPADAGAGKNGDIDCGHHADDNRQPRLDHTEGEHSHLGLLFFLSKYLLVLIARFCAS